MSKTGQKAGRPSTVLIDNSKVLLEDYFFTAILNRKYFFLPGANHRVIIPF
jgi:hypothetical protein